MTRIIIGNCLDVMPTLEADNFDAIVTDPPYHLTTGKKGGSGPASVNLESPYGRARIGTGFMGMKWDGGAVAFESATWQAALRVAKPGAHLLAFGGTRTFHRMMVAIEDAGWELRDTIMWVYGSGFPKSHNLKGEWEGWGTALKPAWEPIIVARKPLIGTVAENMAKHRTGAINIDACRINPGELIPGGGNGHANHGGKFGGGAEYQGARPVVDAHDLGRWPANLILSWPEEEYELRRDLTTEQKRELYGWMSANT